MFLKFKDKEALKTKIIPINETNDSLANKKKKNSVKEVMMKLGTQGDCISKENHTYFWSQIGQSDAPHHVIWGTSGTTYVTSLVS